MNRSDTDWHVVQKFCWATYTVYKRNRVAHGIHAANVDDDNDASKGKK